MSVTREGTAVPAMVGTGFGGLWACIAALALPAPWRNWMLLSAGIVTLALIVRLWRYPAPKSGDGRLFRTRAYRAAVIAELAAICAAWLLLPGIGLQAYVIQILGIIVGLHFIGLWAADRARRLLILAASMCILSSLAALLPETAGPVHVRDAATGLGNALLLWVCAGWRP